MELEQKYPNVDVTGIFLLYYKYLSVIISYIWISLIFGCSCDLMPNGKADALQSVEADLR